MADVRDALGVATRVLTAQAFALDRMFFRAATESAVSARPHHHARKALNAQARSCPTLKTLLALGEACNLQNNSKIERTK